MCAYHEVGMPWGSTINSSSGTCHCSSGDGGTRMIIAISSSSRRAAAAAAAAAAVAATAAGCRNCYRLDR